MIRTVLDTNIYISASFWQGTPKQVLRLFYEQRAILLTSHQILMELEQKLKMDKFAAHFDRTHATPDTILSMIYRTAEMVIPAHIPDGIVRDRKDQMILACAVGGQAGYIVSGDKDLTDLKHYAGIPIMPPSEFLRVLANQ